MNVMMLVMMLIMPLPLVTLMDFRPHPMHLDDLNHSTQTETVQSPNHTDYITQTTDGQTDAVQSPHIISPPVTLKRLQSNCPPTF